MSYQKLIVIGNLGRDPEMRYTLQGSPVCNFSIATNRKRKDGDDTVIWFRIVCWGSLAENCNEHLSKGRQVFVEGTLQADTDGNPKIFTRKDGTCGASFEVTAHVVQFLGGRGGVADDEPVEGDLPF